MSTERRILISWRNLNADHLPCSWFVGRWGGNPAEVPVLEPAGVAVEGDDVGVVDEPVDHGGGDLVWAELAGLKVNSAERRDQEVMDLTHQAMLSVFRARAFDELIGWPGSIAGLSDTGGNSERATRPQVIRTW